jgi:pilus assembly protein CpaC
MSFLVPILTLASIAAAPIAARTQDARTDAEIVLLAGGSTLVSTGSRVELVVVSDPAVADATPVSANEVMVLARAPGLTDVLFKLESGDLMWRKLRVGLDDAELEARLRDVAATDIDVEEIGGTVTVRGTMADAATHDRVKRFMDATGMKWVDMTDTTGMEADLADQLRRLFGVDLQIEDVSGTIAVRGTLPDVATAGLVSRFMASTGLKWVDATRVAGVQQVQLRVRIAEASRTALRQLAFGAVVGGNVFGGVQEPGGSPFQPVSIGPNPNSSISSGDFVWGGNQGGSNLAVSSATTLFGGVASANLEVYLQALTENRYVRLLAEPNLVAISGQQATFLVGGEFPIPIVQGSVVGGGSTITIEYKEYGVRLNFRPEVIGDGRIRLEVAPEVSELSQIGALRQNGFTIPSLTTRRSSTTVELGSGQSFAMAGLLRSTDQGSVAKVPVLGDIPGLGVLFRSVRFEQQQTELVVMVTAELVEPLDDGRSRPMPGDLTESPNDWELFVEGSLFGASKVGNPLSRLKSLGLDGIKGPGAWRRPDEARPFASDPLPAVAPAPEPPAAEPTEGPPPEGAGAPR